MLRATWTSIRTAREPRFGSLAQVALRNRVVVNEMIYYEKLLHGVGTRSARKPRVALESVLYCIEYVTWIDVERRIEAMARSF